MKLSTGPATAATVLNREIFFGIDAAKARQVVTRFVPGEGPKPAESMSEETLLRRATQYLKPGYRVVCVYEAGPMGFNLARKLIALGAECLVVRARQLLERLGGSASSTERAARRDAEAPS